MLKYGKRDGADARAANITDPAYKVLALFFCVIMSRLLISAGHKSKED